MVSYKIKNFVIADFARDNYFQTFQLGNFPINENFSQMLLLYFNTKDFNLDETAINVFNGSPTEYKETE